MGADGTSPASKYGVSSPSRGVGVDDRVAGSQAPAPTADEAAAARTGASALGSFAASSTAVIQGEADSGVAEPASTNIAEPASTNIAGPASTSVVAEPASTSVGEPGSTSVGEPGSTNIGEASTASMAGPASDSVDEAATSVEEPSFASVDEAPSTSVDEAPSTTTVEEAATTTLARPMSVSVNEVPSTSVLEPAAVRDTQAEVGTVTEQATTSGTGSATVRLTETPADGVSESATAPGAGRDADTDTDTGVAVGGVGEIEGAGESARRLSTENSPEVSGREDASIPDDSSSAEMTGTPSPLRAAASLGLDREPIGSPSEHVSRETPEPVSRETAPTADAEEEFPESPRPVDDYPLETPPHAGIHPQKPVDEPGGKPAPTPTDILFGPSPAPIGMGAMTAAQIAARATSDELQRRLLETPIAAATERTLLVNEGRTMGREFPLPAETRVFVVANQKGGVGKTTTTVNVAAGLALYGARILVIDLDPQGNASTALGIEHSEGTPGIYEAIIEGESLSKLLAPCAEHPGIMVVPATIDLAGAEIELVSIVARESRLKKALDAHLAETEAAGEKYDYVFIDCPPSLGLLTVNALTAAREVLVPIQSEYYALEGLSQLLRHIDMVRSHLNPGLDVSTILLTMYDARTKLAGEVAAEVRGHFQDAVLRTAVPRSVRISEAPSHGQTVLAYDPASAGALSYLEASREIAMRNNA
jgi:chromosome partitioning protein